MRFSFSRMECYSSCPHQFQLRYIEELKTLPDWDDPANPLIVGTALHHGIEKGAEEAIREYLNSFPVINDGHINEVIKLRILIPKVRKLLSKYGEYEVELKDGDRFLGYIDYLDRVRSVLLDFKYTTEQNLIRKYLKSPQIHLYKWYLEKLTGYEALRIGYLFVPKTGIRQKKSETIGMFRNRLERELEGMEPRIEYVEYSEEKVNEFLASMKAIEDAKEFPKNQSRLCDWCEYKAYCYEGVDYMITLPKNQRRSAAGVSSKKMWVYGSPFSGKTTLADHFPDPIMINTDGNTHFVTAPVQEIRDRVEKEGRIENVILAWEVFKCTVEELEKGSSFKTVVVDLVEDLYESCRLYIFNQMGITHESDDPFRAWDKVRTEFLSTMRKLTNLPYNVVLISHEDLSKDITKRSGDKVTSIRPNVNEKVANKISGMVDIVIRCVVVDGNYRLAFKSDELVFGGGRINPEVKEIPNDYHTLMSVVYGENEHEETEQGAEAAFIDAEDTYEEEPSEPVRRVRRTRS